MLSQEGRFADLRGRCVSMRLFFWKVKGLQGLQHILRRPKLGTSIRVIEQLEKVSPMLSCAKYTYLNKVEVLPKCCHGECRNIAHGLTTAPSTEGNDPHVFPLSCDHTKYGRDVFCSSHSLLGLLYAHTHPETRIIQDPGLFHLLEYNDTALQ
jgi:hypothetical protein